MKNPANGRFTYGWSVAALVGIVSSALMAAAGNFTMTGPMGAARSEHTATLLTNGQVLVAGSIGYQSLSSAELYDPLTGTWGSAADLNTARGAHTATLLANGQVLVAGGVMDGSFTPLASTELYDPVGGGWTPTGDLNTGRLYHTATLLPYGQVLVVGGLSEPSGSRLASASAELYDPDSGAWNVARSMHTARVYFTATLLPNGKVLIVGGSDGLGYPTVYAGAELYDPSADSWTITGSMHARRYSHTATLLPSGKVLVAGGFDFNHTSETTIRVSSAEVYDPVTGVWTVTGSLNTAHANHTATLLPNGQVLVAGGYKPGGPYGDVITSSCEAYDPATGTWTVTGGFNTPRVHHTATLLSNGQVLVAGGVTPCGGFSLSSSELYDWTKPATVTPILLINPTKASSGAFQFRFTLTNAPNAPCSLLSVLSATNPSAPLTGWTWVGYPTEISPGLFQVSDPGATNAPQRFYRVTSQ
jgi:Galactose oxidase, central domain/Kelch motif